MARTRTTGSAHSDVDKVDENDPGIVAGNAPDPMPEPEKVPEGYLKVQINAKRKDGDKTLPPGVYTLPKAEAMHFVKQGVAKVVAA